MSGTQPSVTHEPTGPTGAAAEGGAPVAVDSAEPAAPTPVTPVVEGPGDDVTAEPAASAEPAPPVIPTEPDPVAAAAVDLAREAAEDVAERGTVGEHLGVTVDDLGLTMHSFACGARGYRGWRWVVTLAHAAGSDRVTVCDVVMLPGAGSILAPQWLPWSDRLAPGDLGAGDDLPYRADDPNLVPGYTVTDVDDADQQLFWEIGLGRERVLGPQGLDDAAKRWRTGSHGPTSEIAVQASAPCLTCGYFLPLAGRLRQNFGVCGNEWSPVDGSVVTTDFGCGAHSETDLELPKPEPLPAHILDETMIERVTIDRSETVEVPVGDQISGAAGLVVGEEVVGEGVAGEEVVEQVEPVTELVTGSVTVEATEQPVSGLGWPAGTELVVVAEVVEGGTRQPTGHPGQPEEPGQPGQPGDDAPAGS